MINFSHYSKELWIILHRKFDTVDSIFVRSLSLLEERNLHGARKFNIEFQDKNNELQEAIKQMDIEIQKKTIELQNTTSSSSSYISETFLLYRQKDLEAKYLSKITMLYVENYKSLFQIFKKKIFSYYLNYYSENTIIEPKYMALIEWLYYGLENLSFYLYPCMNSMLDSLVNTINPKQSSLWEKCKQAFTSTLLSTSGIYDTSINIMFNLDQFCQILNTYTNDCRMDRFQFSEIPADILNIESSKNTNNKITLERLFSKKNVLNKMIEYKIHPVNPNVADKELISNLNNVSNCIFFEHLFLEIKECVFMIENLTYNIDLRNIKDTLSIVHDYVENISLQN